MEIDVHERVNRSSRLNFLLDLIILEYMCRADSLAQLQASVQSMNRRDARNFLRGYRLAVATPLRSMLDFIVGSGHWLGLEYDDRLHHWLVNSSGERGGNVLAAISDPGSDLGRLCSELHDLQGSLRISDGDFEDVTSIIERCSAFASTFRSALGTCQIVLQVDGSEVEGSDSLLRVLIAERVVDYTWEPSHFTNSAFRMVWGGEVEWEPVGDEYTLGAQTHLDGVFSWPVDRGIPGLWRNRLSFGFDMVLRMAKVTLPSHAESGSAALFRGEWFNELRLFVNPLFPMGAWPSSVYGLGEFFEYSKSSLLEHLTEKGDENLAPVPPKQRLAAILGADAVLLFAPGSFTDFMDLEIFVSGAIATHPDAQVEVLLATHSVESDDRDWVSIAVRCRRESMISNHTRWYLFYKMYHEGFVTDSDVGRAINEVESLLVRFKTNLSVETIEGISDRDILAYCELPSFRAMRELSQRAVDINSELRSGISELLASYWLQAQGFSNVKVSLKRASLGKYEYDALGVKDEECLVIEVKGGEVVDEELLQQIARLGDKVENLYGRLPALAEALAHEGSIKTVSGLFISLADLTEVQLGNGSVTVWDYNDFVENLRLSGLGSRMVGLLDRGNIIHSISAGDRFGGYLDVGL